MAKRLEAIPTENSINLDSRLFNKVYFPLLFKIYNYMVLYGGSGSGKCFEKDTEVVMYSGEVKKVQDVRVGDLLMGADSTPRKVLELSRGTDQLYRVHQNKGKDYVVNAQHVLCLRKSDGCIGRTGQKKRYPDYKEHVNIPVSEYLGKSDRWKRNFLGYRTAVEFEKKEVTLDPYYLGVWLGDGTSSQSDITTEDAEIITFLEEYAKRENEYISEKYKKNDTVTMTFNGEKHPENVRREWAKIVAYINKHGWKWSLSYSSICRDTGFSRRNVSLWKTQQDFIDMVRYYEEYPEPYDLNVLRKRVKQKTIFYRLKDYDLINNKHIPKDYLYNAREIRLQLLAGIIDTDGSLHGNCYDIVQKNKKLSEQIIYLANSLGMRASFKECRKTCVNNGMVGTYYRINVSGNTQDIPVKIKRKKITKYNKAVDPMSTGITVEPYYVGEYYGFEVDGDHKFLLSDFTVVHNSTFVAQMLAVQMTIFAGRNLVCLRKQKTDCISSCFGEIYHYLKKFKLVRYWKIQRNPDHRMINRVNGNQIVFEGVDSIEDIKSIKFVNDTDSEEGDDNLTDAWYEEVNAEKDVEVIREIDRRIRDPKIKGRIILTFNPVLRTHWLFDLVMKEWQMDGVDSFVLKTTYKDNMFRPKEYDAKLERYQYTDPYAYQVYTLGEWGTTGQSVFDKNVIYARLLELEKTYSQRPYTTGSFDFAVNESGLVDEDNKERPITFMPNPSGEVKIFKDVEHRHPYVVAVDTAGEGSDYYAAHVCDNTTGEEVAVFHSNKNPDRCIEQVYCLCCYYNHALYCPESNFDSYPIKYFTMLNYPSIYRRQSPLDKTKIRAEDKYGFRTGVDNRQSMLTELVKFVNDNVHLINDPATLDEMLTFTHQEKKLKGIWWGAENGAHDDLVMSLAIMLQARSQQVMGMVTDTKKLNGSYTREELEDMLEEGRIDRFAMQEYINSHDLYMESQEDVRSYAGKRRSKYAC